MTTKGETSDHGNWTILMSVNNGYFDFFQNWMHFYKKLDLKRSLRVIAEDDEVFLKLQQLNTSSFFNVERSWRNPPRSVVVYGSKGFSELASGRPSYILKYLQKGENLLYADADSVWLRDPFPFFTGDFDMWMQVDKTPSNMCTGLIAVKSNNKTMQLMKTWETSLQKHLEIDQTAFNKIYKTSTVHLKQLDTKRFPSGQLYFERFNKSLQEEVVIVHNNFIIGHEPKLKRFVKHKLWFT
ncbi:uncharacterized protein LOC132712862 [Ruditapes philippinarum]|uniref:uncharacterized protein LOC132712862 n=1 Tax=Ruditapes philippinarum TaxID=129788 RepID=UPI00295A920D|nr:uncharacterized protein LOC132712862 [Ruditapes philippinarum]